MYFIVKLYVLVKLYTYVVFQFYDLYIIPYSDTVTNKKEIYIFTWAGECNLVFY